MLVQVDPLRRPEREFAVHDRDRERRRRQRGRNFVLVAGNKQEIGRSEMYSGTSAVESGIASVRTNAPDAKVDDKTA